MSERRVVKAQLACVRCRKFKARCDNEPEPCTRCIKANKECVRKPRDEAERAKMRAKRQLPQSRFEISDDSSWADDFSVYSEGDRGWNGPLDHDHSQEMASGQRSISPPLVQRDPAHQSFQEDPATPNLMRNQSWEGAHLNTTSHDALRHPETSTVPNPFRLPINHQQDSSKASSPPNPFRRPDNHQWDGMVNTTPKALKSGIQKSPGSGERPLLDFWGVEKRKNPFEAPRQRVSSTVGHAGEEGGIKKPRIAPNPVETSLPRDMRMNTMVSVCLNGDKPGRAKQKRIGDCKSMESLFAEMARGWKDEGVDEENCYIEVTYDWKSETDEGRVAYLERDDESGLGDLYHEIKENPCWDYEADAWCIINMKICQKY